MSQKLIVITLVLFGAVSAAALWQHGYWSIVTPHFQSTAGAQVFADLLIALTLVLIWMWRDASTQGRPFWPWLMATLAFGSFGPLLYLLTRRTSPPRD